MKLSSVRALKEQIVAEGVQLIESAASALSFRSFVVRRSRGGQAINHIALGVSPTADKKSFRLAVRPQRSGPLTSEIVNDIRKKARGEVDVKFIGNIVKFDETRPAFYQARRRPLRIGSSISDVDPNIISAGTLGCFVFGRNSPHNIGMLTNNHVVANENRNRAGAEVVQQGTLDGGSLPNDLVGQLGRFVSLKTNAANFVDAAIANIFDDVPYDPRTVGTLGDLTGTEDVLNLDNNARVFKVGRTTGQTAGRITAFEISDIRVQYDTGVLRFDNQIEIEGTGSTAFSDSGDSGSVIVDENLRAIGLLFAGGSVGGSNGMGLTYANPIGVVLDALNVDLEL